MPANKYKCAFIRIINPYKDEYRIISIRGKHQSLTLALKQAIKDNTLKEEDFWHSTIQFDGSGTVKHIALVGKKLNDQQNPFKHVKPRPLSVPV